MQALQAKAQEGFAALVAYFGENPNSIPSDSTFWSPIAKFAQTFSHAQQDVLSNQQVCQGCKLIFGFGIAFRQDKSYLFSRLFLLFLGSVPLSEMQYLEGACVKQQGGWLT